MYICHDCVSERKNNMIIPIKYIHLEIRICFYIVKNNFLISLKF